MSLNNEEKRAFQTTTTTTPRPFDEASSTSWTAFEESSNAFGEEQGGEEGKLCVIGASEDATSNGDDKDVFHILFETATAANSFRTATTRNETSDPDMLLGDVVAIDANKNTNTNPSAKVFSAGASASSASPQLQIIASTAAEDSSLSLRPRPPRSSLRALLDEEQPLNDAEISILRSLLPPPIKSSHGHKKKRSRTGSDFSDDSESSGSLDDDDNRSVDTATRNSTIKSKLSPDTFSFLITSPVQSSPFCAGLFILLLKGGIFSLIAANLIDMSDAENPLSIPTSVPGPVIVGQFLALFIAVASQDDIVTALNLADEGYSHSFMVRAHPAATKHKWLLGITTLFLTGALGLAVTFLLVVTSFEVVELMLNFTAIEFVSLLDNAAFMLAQRGLLGLASKIRAEEIETKKYRVPRERQKTPRKQIIILVISYLLLVGGWTVIFNRQISGRYTPQTILVQFDDQVALELGTFSGTYVLQNERWAAGHARIRYDKTSGEGSFAYCEENEFWTFRLHPGNPCEDILVRSFPTETFDITTTAENQWFVTPNSELGRFFPMDIFHISLGCDLDEDCGGLGHGVCEDDRCICNPGYFGTSCDFSEAESCARLELDSESLSTQGIRRFATTYNVLIDGSGQKVTMYDRQVYVSDFNSGDSVDLIVYTGLRWVLTQLPAELNATESTLSAVLLRDVAFTAQTILSSPYYLISEPLLVNTQGSSATPLDLQWFPVRVVGNETKVSLAVVLDIFCAICNKESNPCLYENACDNGSCRCTNGASGTLCQHTPTADGKCNSEVFNDAAFAFDGGDCCADTCYNTEENVCGVVQTHGVDNLFVGFPNCADFFTSCDFASPCFKVQTEYIESLSKYDEAIVMLAANGRIVAVAEPALDTIRVFDNVDAGWKQRGPSLEGSRRSLFGRKLAMAFFPGEVIGRISSELPVVMAIGYGAEGEASVRVVRWTSSLSEWSVIAGDIQLCREPGCDLSSLDVATDGNRITLAASTSLNNGTTVLYTSISNFTNAGAWEPVAIVNGTIASLSELGDIVAVARTDEPVVTRIQVPINTYEALPQVLSVHNMSEFGPGSSIVGLKMSPSGDHITTALADSSQTFSLTRYHVKTLSPRPHFGTSLGIKETPISDFSADGMIVSLTGAFDGIQGGRNFQSYKFSEQTQRWKKLGSAVPVSTRAQEFSISSDGATFVVGGDSPTDVYRLGKECNGTEVQLSMSMDSLPTNIFWSMQSYEYLDDIIITTETIAKTCDRCYKDSLFRALVFHTVCVPTTECLRFTFEVDDGFEDGSGMILFIEGQERIILNSTSYTPVDVQIHDNEMCQRQTNLTCIDGQSVLTMIIQLDGNPQETLWVLRDGSNTILDRGSYLTTERVVRQYCISSFECSSLTFEDNRGDGFASNSGDGGYMLYVDGILTVDRSGEIGFGEQVFFGQCANDAVKPRVQVELLIEFDRTPNETTWHIEDSAGRMVASGGPYLELQQLVPDPIILPVNCSAQGIFANITLGSINATIPYDGLNTTIPFTLENGTVPVNYTVGDFSYSLETFQDLALLYYESLNVSSLEELFLFCEPWIYNLNTTNTTTITNATVDMEPTFNETICNATVESVFDLCGNNLGLLELFSLFNLTLNVTELFEYKYVNLNGTNATDFDFGFSLQTTETLYLFPEEVHTLFFQGGGEDGLFAGSYELLYGHVSATNTTGSSGNFSFALPPTMDTLTDNKSPSNLLNCTNTTMATMNSSAVLTGNASCN